MIHTLSMFNTGQVTLPKSWREKHKTRKFIAEETADGALIIRPLDKDKTVYYESKDGFGLYCADGLDSDKILAQIKKLNG